MVVLKRLLLIFCLLLFNFYGYITCNVSEDLNTTFQDNFSLLREGNELQLQRISQNKCKDESIKQSLHTCVSAGSKCFQKSSQYCCSAACVASSEQGDPANLKFSCKCDQSKKSQRCNTNADCNTSNCNGYLFRKISCCEMAKHGTMKSMSFCKCTRNIPKDSTGCK